MRNLDSAPGREAFLTAPLKNSDIIENHEHKEYYSLSHTASKTYITMKGSLQQASDLCISRYYNRGSDGFLIISLKGEIILVRECHNCGSWVPPECCDRYKSWTERSIVK